MARVEILDSATEPGWAADGSHHFNIAGRGYILHCCDYEHYVTYLRDDIGQTIGRTLLTRGEAERLIRHYRSWAEPMEVYSALDKARHDYGEHHKQCWYALRDLAIATRDIRRRRPPCPFCSKRLRIPFDPCEARMQFYRTIGLRHFFELPRTDIIKRWRGWFIYCLQDNQRLPDEIKRQLDWYFQEHTEPVCQPGCEIARFSRWWANRHEHYRQQDKQRARYRKETQWLNAAKTELRKVRQYLHHEASPSQGKESKRASISRAS